MQSQVQTRTWKRPREECSVMEEEHSSGGNSHHHSSKRIKVIGDSKQNFMTEAAHQPIHPCVSSDSDHHHLRHHQHHHHQQQQHHAQHQQSSGQRSSERQSPIPQTGSEDYHTMNHLLGSLHMTRRRQRALEAGVHQPSQQIPTNFDEQLRHQQNDYPRRDSHLQSGKKYAVTLRVDSNLY